VRVVVVGSGISGLSAAWLLSTKHEVSVFEAAPRLGGHANTVDVDAPEGRCPIDTGFIVYNTACYPNLIALFDRLQVPTAETDMSFAVSLDGGGYEYSGSGLGGLFGQPSNLANLAHWRMVREILRFFREANALDLKAIDASVTLEDWLSERGYSKRFVHAHIVPMGAAIWSTPADEMLAFPFAAFIRFFANHGLLQSFNRPAWRTVRGGSREYVQRISSQISAQSAGRMALGDAVVAVEGGAQQVVVKTASGNRETFDAALIACHADEARGLVSTDDAAAHSVLSAFRYAANEAVLHTDPLQMPRRRRLWSSWNYIGGAHERNGGRSERLAATYWMNRLQPLQTKTDYFVTLNPLTAIASEHVVQRFSYQHPMFDETALSAQAKLSSLQGRNSIWFAGSYFGYGFHEDGVQAGLAAAEDMSLHIGGGNGRVARPWTWDQRYGRISTPASTVRDAGRITSDGAVEVGV
jgi:uncharacterized protein